MNDLLASFKKWFENSSAKQKWFAGLLAFSLLATGMLLSLGGSSTSVTQDPLGSTPFYFVSAFVKLLAVLLLIVGSAVIFRRWLQPGMSRKSNRQMQLLETVRLSPKQALHLVMIGDQKLLIGATDQNVSLIAPIENQLAPSTETETPPQPTLDFGAMLQAFSVSSEQLPVKE